jgi:hypothetical protein
MVLLFVPQYASGLQPIISPDERATAADRGREHLPPDAFILEPTPPPRAL